MDQEDRNRMKYIKTARMDEIERQDRNDITDYSHPNAGDNAAFIEYALASWNLPEIDVRDPQQVEDRIKLYFKYCHDRDRRPTVIGMANWLGVTKRTIEYWRSGDRRAKTHTKILERAFGYLEELWAEYMITGKVNPATGIFLGKNWYDYKDVKDVVVTPQQNPFDGAEDPDDVARKYLSGMVGVEAIDSEGSVD